MRRFGGLNCHLKRLQHAGLQRHGGPSFSGVGRWGLGLAFTVTKKCLPPERGVDGYPHNSCTPTGARIDGAQPPQRRNDALLPQAQHSPLAVPTHTLTHLPVPSLHLCGFMLYGRGSRVGVRVLGLGLGLGLVLLCLFMPVLQSSALGSGPSADE